jgi:hypothetical protein
MRHIFIVALFMTSSESFARNVFLNGKDVSSAVGKKLEGVNISIAENGDIYISAPQYQVLEEVSYTPLGQGAKDSKASGTPESRSRTYSSLPSSVPSNIPSAVSSSALPDSPASDLAKDIGLEEKAGSKVSPP